MWQSSEVRFSTDHPTAAGHFPSNPIIPGALLLDAVVRVIAGTAESDRQIEIRVAKFLHVVRPGEAIRIRWQSAAGRSIKFECRLMPADTLAVTGTLGLLEVSP